MRARTTLRSAPAIAVALLAAACRSTAPLPAPVSEPAPGASLLARGGNGAIRVMTWNVGTDSIFPEANRERAAGFARVLRALDPDVACLQEVWRGSAAVAELFDSALPLDGGVQWAHHGFLDNAILSRRPLDRRASGKVETRPGRLRGHAMALSGQGTATPLYLVCAHFESRAAVGHREKQADLLVSQLVRNQARRIPPDGTPIVVLGDLNAAAGHSTRFLRWIQQGRVGGNRSGLDRGPDWDGSDLVDARPRHNGRGEEHWTWRDDTTELAPAALDRIFYTGSVLTPAKAFVLDAAALSDAELAAAGLERGDTMLDPASGIHDHLPVVVDFLDRRLPGAGKIRGSLLFSNGFEAGVPCLRWSSWVKGGCFGN